jgi:EAL and modified HD-GYP domain-containing signal transduction protein
MVIMDLLNLVMGHADFPAIEAKFKLDAALSYKLLRFINSPAVGLRYPIKSIGQALVMLGHDQLYRWLTLLLFTHEQGDPRSRALLRNAVVRARLTETLGEQHISRGERGGLFITGILSMLDALLGLPLEQALARLKLPEAVIDALLEGTGPYAPYLQLAQACEQFDQDRIAQLSVQARLTPDAVNLAHVNALIWSEGLEE